MEFKLNKIDTDIRLKLQEETSDKKVHYSKNISPSKDTIQERRDFNKNSEKKKNAKVRNHKKFITIDGIKYGDSIDIIVEKEQKINDENFKGQILDLKK